MKRIRQLLEDSKSESITVNIKSWKDRKGRDCSFRLPRLPLSCKGAGTQEQLLLTWTNAHHSTMWGILAALTWDHSSRIGAAASPAGDYPARMRSSGSAELPASWSKKARADWLSQCCDTARHCSASLSAKGFWITDPSEFLTTRWAPRSPIMLFCWALTQEAFPSRKSLFLLERYCWVASCLANMRVCWTSWIFGLCVLLPWRRSQLYPVQLSVVISLFLLWIWLQVLLVQRGQEHRAGDRWQGHCRDQWDQHRLQCSHTWWCGEGSSLLRCGDVHILEDKLRI